jgi:hypothetical protein
MATKNKHSHTQYRRLVIEAETREGQIWLGDDEGHFVQKAVGVLDTHLLPGSYVVEFALGGRTYPVTLDSPLHLSERRIRSGPSCPRPTIRFPVA